MSLNDPRWGNQGNDRDRNEGNQGPPDLEEIYRDLSRKWRSLFGKKGSGGQGGDGGGGGNFNAKFFGSGIGVLALLGLGVWAASGFYIVDASQRGVEMRFGKSNTHAMVGQRGTVTTVVGGIDNPGRVKIGGEEWRAISESDEPLAEGLVVEIISVDSATVIVRPITAEPKVFTTFLFS